MRYVDTFSFPVGAHSAARHWLQLPKITIFGAKNAYYSIVSHGIVWYCMELNCILLHSFACNCIVSYGIAWYRIISYGIAWYCIVLHFTIAMQCIVGFGARCISQETHLKYPRCYMHLWCCFLHRIVVDTYKTASEISRYFSPFNIGKEIIIFEGWVI